VILGSLALVLLLIVALPAVRIRRLRASERELATAVEERTAELLSVTEQMRELSLRDPLTGLRNRRFLWEVLPGIAAELDRQRRRRGSGDVDRRAEDDRVLGLLFIDIDHFKQVNDSLGHDAGDRLLVQIAELLQSSVRGDDMVVRWGGEEFLLVLQRTPRDLLAVFADRIRVSVARTDFEVGPERTVRRTCSIGACTYPFFPDPERDLDLEQAIGLADAALYRAKDAGRDRVVQVAPGESAPGPQTAAVLGIDLERAASAGWVELDERG
jgi:diguanylate cyclase (GGDEF)-like protein